MKSQPECFGCYYQDDEHSNKHCSAVCVWRFMCHAFCNGLPFTIPTTEEKRMLVYLAGPMRGYPDLNFPLFREAAEKLRAKGWDVIDPSEGEDPKQQLKPIEEYMAHDLPLVCKADAIVLLPGWQRSQGTSIELAVAQRLGKDVYEYDEV